MKLLRQNFQAIFMTYYAIFIFLIFNREFRFFSIDLRYVLVVLGLILLLTAGTNKSNRNTFNLDDRVLLLLLLSLLLSNFMWFFNGIKFDLAIFKNLFILFSFNALNIIVILKNKKYLNFELTTRFMIISFIVLSVSVYLSRLGIEIPFKSDQQQVFCTIDNGIQIMRTCRYAGLAADPNNVTFLSFIMIIFTIFSKEINRIKLLIFIFSFLNIYFSVSKTLVLIGLPVIVLYLIVYNTKLIAYFKRINLLFIVFISILPFILVLLRPMSQLETLYVRYSLWDRGIDLFASNPILGNGLGAFKTTVNLAYSEVGGWITQAHSTYIQILSDHGIISFILFMLISYRILNSKFKVTTLSYAMFLVFGLMFELMYQSYIVFFLAVLPSLRLQKSQIEKSAAVFITNGLKSGGAERVIITQAESFQKSGISSFIIIKGGEINYDFDNSIKVFKMRENDSSSNILYKIFDIFAFSFYIEETLESISQNYNFEIITTHLPIPHISMRMTSYSLRNIYVIHNVYSSMKVSNWKLKPCLKLLYYKQAVVSVADGALKELINTYKIKPYKTSVILNPVNLTEIDSKMNEKIPYKDYVLFCGRLEEIKRPLLAIELFRKSVAFNELKMLIVGSGSMMSIIEKYINDNELNNKVILVGWQKNVYPFLKNARAALMTSTNEALSMVIIEAFSVGTPIISFDCDFGPRELIPHEFNYLLVPYDDNVKYIEAIRKVLISKQETDRYRKYAEKFDVEMVNLKYVEFYKNIFENSN